MMKTHALSVRVACARLLLTVALSLPGLGCSSSEESAPNYLIGSGVGDITGPIVDVAFSGYVRPTHVANGIHTRLKARAFIIGEVDESRRLVFVTTELLNMSHEVRLSVVENLRAKHGDLYTLDNVVLSATHTHSSPGGYSHDGAFREDYFDAVVSGITEAIEMAHQDLGSKVLERIRNELTETTKVEQFPRMENRQMIMVLSPKVSLPSPKK